jgi:hypothetical protein
MTKGGGVEIKCDACGGTGSPPAREPEPGRRRIYPGRCGYIGITEAKVPKEFTFPMWSHFPRRLLRQYPR